MFTTNFDKAFQWVILGVEGGYVNHPQDPGGRTIYGITEKYYPKEWENGPPTLDRAKQFYFDTFWEPLHLSNIDAVEIAIEVFDSAVLHGQSKAVLLLQRAYNFWANIEPTKYSRVKEDGVLGNKTVTAVNYFCSTTCNRDALYVMLNVMQANKLLENNNGKFIKGWFAKRIIPPYYSDLMEA